MPRQQSSPMETMLTCFHATVYVVPACNHHLSDLREAFAFGWPGY